ncbi:MAG: YIP1 family protein [Gemmatimonadota bacterium]|nr:YIP1 family protein [Gemmatimonadota bacterium]
MTSPHNTGTSAEPVSAKPAGLWEDFIDIFISPAEVFERRRNSGFFVPLIVFAVVSTVISIVGHGAMQPILDAEFARGIASAAKQNPNMSPAAMESARGMSDKFFPVIVAVVSLLTPLMVGVLLWITGKFVSAKEGIGAACMIAAYSFLPRILDTILRIVQGFMLDPSGLNGAYRVTLSPARFLDPDTASPVMIALLGRIDLFTIWVTILLAVGLSVVARIPRSRAAIAAVLVWVLASLPAVFQALRAS